MFKALLKSRFQMMMAQLFKKNQTKKKKPIILKIAIGILVLYVVACFFGLFGMSFAGMVEPFHQVNLDWFYFVLAALMALILMIIGSIFATQTQLYDAKDNELLLSMPIAPWMILFSRMAVLYILNLAYELTLFIPVGFVYFYKLGVTVSSLICFIVIALVFPFVGLVLSSLLGWVVSLIGARTRNKSMMTIILSLAFFFAYFYVLSNFDTYIQKLIKNGDLFAEKIKGAVAPLFWLGSSIANGNFAYLALVIVIIGALFAVMYTILSKSFIHILTTKKGFAKRKYVAKEMKVASQNGAIMRKEWKRFLTSPIYILNCGLGVIFMLIGAVMVVVKKEKILTVFDIFVQNPDKIGAYFILALCGVATVNLVTAPSISLEGKNLWLVKSLPIPTKTILKSKLKLHLQITLPATILAAVIIMITLYVSPWYCFLLIATPVAMNVFVALFGLIVNLHFPKFDWISEASVIKQSMSVFISMFGSMGMILAPALIYGFVVSGMVTIEIYIAIITVLLAALDAYLYYYLMTRGCKIFNQL